MRVREGSTVELDRGQFLGEEATVLEIRGDGRALVRFNEHTSEVEVDLEDVILIAS